MAKKKQNLRAIGITCGIGSLLVGARSAGFDVEGNVEWRQYYHQPDEMGRNTFKENFRGAVFKEKYEDLELDEIARMMGADLAMGHPECGRFSRLSGSVKNKDVRAQDPGDIPLFVELVAKFKPRFFVMDDLPKSFGAYPMAKYAEMLPEYDLFPEWVSNWGYGNVQKGRDRMFMLGALKSEKWVFFAGEQTHTTTVRDILEELPEPRRGSNFPNQDPHDGTLDCFRALNLGGFRKKNSWSEVQDYFRDKRGGFTLEYPTAEGRLVKRIGFLKGHWDGPSHVLTGGNAILHHLRCDPYTIRERARIQGFPDDFVFYGTILNDRGEWNHDTNMHMVKQTGKAMPVQFATFVSHQVADFIEGRPGPTESRRVIRPNEDVDAAKKWYCQEIGYTDQEKACQACWLAARCSIRREKYGLGPPIVEAAQRPPRAPTEPRPRKKKIDAVQREVQTETMTFTGGAK